MAIELMATIRLQDNLSPALHAVDKTLVGMAGFAAVSAGIGSAVKSFAGFEQTIRQATVIAGGSEQDFKNMGTAVKEMALDSQQSAQEIASAMTDLASAGLDTNEAIAAMPGILSAATASMTDLGVVSDTVTTALSIWGMAATDSTKVSDIMAEAANRTKLSVSDMSYVLKYAGASANAAGMSLEEVAAAAGLIVNAGIEGSTAGTALRQGFNQLTKTAGPAKKAMDAVGFSAVNADGSIKSMVDIVTDLDAVMMKMTDAEKISFMSSTVGTEAMSAFMSLVDAGPEKLQSLQVALENSEGASEKAAKAMSQGLAGSLKSLQNAIEAFKLGAGEAFAPLVAGVADFIATADFDSMVESLAGIGTAALDVAKVIMDNWTTIQNTVVLAAYALGTYKAITLAVATAQLTLAAGIAIFNGLKTAINLAKAAQIAFNLALLANPIGVVITAVTALIGVGILLYQNWDKVTASTKEAWEQFKQGKGVITLLLGPLGLIIKTAITIAKEWKSTESVWSNVWNGMKSSAEDTVNTVIAGVNKMIDVINKLPGVNIPIVASVNWTNDVPAANSAANAAGSVSNSSVAGPVMMANKGGWNEIRNNQTPRLLHAGERVLTAVENDNYSKMMTHDMSAAFANVQAVGNLLSPRSIVSGQNDAGNPTDFSAGAKQITASIMALDKRPQQVFKDNSSEGVSDYVQQWLLNRDKSAANFATAAPAANVTVNQNSTSLDVSGALASMQSRITDSLSALSIPDGTRDANIVSGAVPFEMPQLDASNARLVERSAVTTTNNYNTYNSEAAAKQESKAPEQHNYFEINNPVIREEQDLDDLMTRIADAIKDYY